MAKKEPQTDRLQELKGDIRTEVFSLVVRKFTKDTAVE